MARPVVKMGLAACIALGAQAPGPAGQDAAEAREIEVTAAWYHFSPDPIVVRQGERVRLLVRSADVTHGFEIRELRINELIPFGGEAVVVELTAHEAGTFEVICSEYCGTGHDDMRGTLIVEAGEAQGGGP